MLVSVIMPAYNASKFIEKTIDSVRKQTYQDWELIVVNDCSKDNTAALVAELAKADSRIRLIDRTENCGVAVVRNIGIQEAKGDYIALLDSDDLWTPDKLTRQINLALETRADILYCSYDFVDETGKEVLKPFIVPEQTDFKKMLASSVISCSTAMIRADLLKGHPFNPEYYHEDYVLWMELLKIANVTAAGDPKVLAHYRQVSGSRSNNKGNAAKERWKIYRGPLKLGVIQSGIAFAQYAIRGVLKYYT